ncbi:hypothetical protein KG089_05315 [Carnobacteriaceae bacterium zg-ZUI252]|nr:hypothetical protein [Carnobacteriaceae bacterium zg-ZUI252]
MHVTCQWFKEVEVAQRYFEKYEWRLVSIEQLRENLYRIKGAKRQGNICLYLRDGQLYEFDRFDYKKIDDNSAKLSSNKKIYS